MSRPESRSSFLLRRCWSGVGLGALLLLAPALLQATAAGYGPTRSGDSLWVLYNRPEVAASGNRFAWMVVTQRLNPHALSNPCNAGSLRIGAQLLLPSAAQVAQIEPAAAHQEYLRQVEEWKNRYRMEAQVTCSDWFNALDLTTPPDSSSDSSSELFSEPSPEPHAAAPLSSPPSDPPAPAEQRSSPPLSPSSDAFPIATAAEEEEGSELLPPPVSEVGTAPQPVSEVSTAPPPVGEVGTAPPPAVEESKAPPPAAPAASDPPTRSRAAWLLLLLPLLALALLLFGWRYRRRWSPASGAGESGPRRFSYQRKILLTVTLAVILGQLFYAAFNVRSFQQSYLESVQAQSYRLADYLRQDVEYILGLGIPLQRLVRVELSLAELLEASTEIAFIEITNREQRVIYYADREQMLRYQEEESPLSALQQPNAERHNLLRSGFGLAITRAESDLRIPLHNPRSGEPVGAIQIRISAQQIYAATRGIIWDILTVILVSLLITFEFTAFFARRSFSQPLQRLTIALRRAAHSGRPLPTKGWGTVHGISQLIHRFNQRITPAANGAGDPERQQIEQALARLRQRLAKQPAPSSSATLPTPPAAETLSYSDIRPFVFLFFIAYNLPLSFFPLFVASFDYPAWGLPDTMMIGLPISLFMLFFALSMLFSGRWLDRVGWFRPLLIGSTLFATGLLLTAFAESYSSMLLYRALTAIGLGIGFMGFQQFVINNTNSQQRGLGLAAFLAAFFAGEIVGSVVGGMLAERLGYATIFLLSGLLAALALAGIYTLFRRTAEPSSAASNHPKLRAAQLFGALRDREFLAVVIFQAIPAKIALIGFLVYFVPLYLAQLGTLQGDIGRIVMTYALILVLLGPLLSHALNRPAYRRYYLLTGGLLTALAMLSFGLAANSLMVLLLVAALGISHTLSLATQAALVAETRLVQRLGSGTGMGIYRFWERFGSVAGPFVMAALIASLGYQYAVVALGGLLLLSTLFYILLLQPKAQPVNMLASKV